MGLYIFIGVIVFLLLILVGMFNSLVARRNQVRNVFATCDVMMKKRYDLIPNLVSTVKGYAAHERELFEGITAARAKAMDSGAAGGERVLADNALTGMLSRLFAVVENYPNLKASDNFLHLQRTLNEVEEQLSAARRAYNASVTDYNNAVEMFPTNLIAGTFGFAREPFFEIPDTQRTAPNVADTLNS